MTRGDPVKYRALGGHVYDAVVLGTRPDGRLDIDLIVSPTERLTLSRIVLAENEAGARRGQAFPAS